MGVQGFGSVEAERDYERQLQSVKLVDLHAVYHKYFRALLAPKGYAACAAVAHSAAHVPRGAVVPCRLCATERTPTASWPTCRRPIGGYVRPCGSWSRGSLFRALTRLPPTTRCR